jgi:hypothetical protein
MRPQPADPDRPPRAFRLSSVFLVSLIVVSALAVSAAGALWVVGDIVGFRSTAAEIRTRYEDFARQRLEREVERAVAYIEFRIASLEGELRTRLEERVRRTPSPARLSTRNSTAAAWATTRHWAACSRCCGRSASTTGVATSSPPH